MYVLRGKAKYTVSNNFPFEADPVRPINVIFYACNYEDSVLLLGANFDRTRLYLSIDNGETWQNIWRKGPEDSQLSEALYTNNPDLNRSILIASGNKLFLSTDLEQYSSDTWEEVLAMDSSWLNRTLAWDICDNILLRGEYGTKNEQDPPRRVYLSQDHGQTWTTIYDPAINDMVDPANHHIHAVAFDPWCNNRIWVTIADGLNGNVIYSDDWGQTWNKLHQTVVHQPTNIICTPRAVLFASDERPSGFRVWKRDLMEMRSMVGTSDLEFLWTPDRLASPTLNGYAFRQGAHYMDMLDSYPYTLVVPWTGGGYPTPLRLMTSPDGLHWWEFWSIDNFRFDGKFDVYNVAGPASNDPKKRIYIRGSLTGSGVHTVTIEHPGWVNIES